MAEKEYIEREYMVEIITMLKSEKGDIRVMDTETLLYFIRKVPTADVVPVRHGHWISKNPHGYEWVFVCSNCDYVDGFPFNDRNNYCPNCGAKMDGGIGNG